MVGSDNDAAEKGPTFLEMYLGGDADTRDPMISPLLAGDLSGLPEALFIQAECDALCDDGLIYAKRLRDAGVQVECELYRGMPHAFILRTYDETFAALDRICAFLSR
jgi:acetyl esterase